MYVARCGSKESATNTEADLTSKPVVNAVAGLTLHALQVQLCAQLLGRRQVLNDSPRPLPPQRQFVGFAEDGLIKPAASALLTAQNALGATGFIILLMSVSLGTTRCPHNLKTQCERLRLTLAPLAQLTTLLLLMKLLDMAISCMCTTSPPTVVTPSLNRSVWQAFAPLTIHSEVRIQDPHKKSWDQCCTIVRIGARHAHRVWLPSGRGCWRKRRSLCPLPDFQNRRSAVDCDILVLSLFLSFFLFLQTSLSFGLKGRGDDTHCRCMMQCVQYVVRPRQKKLLVQRK